MVDFFNAGYNMYLLHIFHNELGENRIFRKEHCLIDQSVDIRRIETNAIYFNCGCLFELGRRDTTPPNFFPRHQHLKLNLGKTFYASSPFLMYLTTVFSLDGHLISITNYVIKNSI